MKLKKDEIDAKLSRLSGWKFSNDSIVKDFKLKDFQEAMGFVVKIALAAEKMEHHPDMTIEYDRVRIILTTHTVEGITEKDFDLAEKIDKFVSA